jgi:hypothetical protein
VVIGLIPEVSDELLEQLESRFQLFPPRLISELSRGKLREAFISLGEQLLILESLFGQVVQNVVMARKLAS